MAERPQFPECQICLLRLAKSATEAAVKNDPAKRIEVEQAAKRVLAQGLEQGLRSPAISSRMLLEVRRLSGVDDPFFDFKQREMEKARAVIEDWGALDVLGDLRGLVAWAALGNSFDFFQEPSETLAGLQSNSQQGVLFHHDDLSLFAEFLERSPKLALFLADNAGEIYFDLPLVDYLRGRVDRVVLVVKGGPAQNDLTRADLERGGLIQRVGDLADTGAEAAGIDWQMVSAEFLNLLEQADLVVAKGMANYLSTLEHGLPCPGFFIFKLKCQPLRDLWDAPPESFWSIWREPGHE
jgi:uncharacterized protein with ATP-grasp and redox domains